MPTPGREGERAGATATMAKTPFFFCRDAFEKTLSAMDYFLAVPRLNMNILQGARGRR